MATVPNPSLETLYESDFEDEDLPSTAPTLTNILESYETDSFLHSNFEKSMKQSLPEPSRKILQQTKLKERFGLQRNSVKFNIAFSSPRMQPHFFFQKKIGDYKVIKKIGKGRYGIVKLAEHVSTQKKVAVKIINKVGLNPYEKDTVMSEPEVMSYLDHPHILKLYEVMETAHEICMILQYAQNGDLFDYITKKGKLKEKEARRIFIQIVSAIEYCHKKDLVHRDIKAENILLDENKDVLLADFGFSGIVDSECKFESSCGSLYYSSPELINGTSNVGKEVDIWALGVLLYLMVTGTLPFSASNDFVCYKLIKKGTYKSPKAVSTECKDLISKMLNTDPKQRITIEDVSSHPWLLKKK